MVRPSRAAASAAHTVRRRTLGSFPTRSVGKAASELRADQSPRIHPPAAAAKPPHIATVAKARRFTAERDRGRKAEIEGHLVRVLQAAGPSKIHDVKALASILYGSDVRLEDRHLKNARRWAQRLQRLGYPLVNVDEAGRLLSRIDAVKRSRSSRRLLYRFDGDSCWAIRAVEDLKQSTVAEGLVALEACTPPPVFFEQLVHLQERLLDTVNPDAYAAARAGFDAAMTVYSRHRLSAAVRLGSCRPG